MKSTEQVTPEDLFRTTDVSPDVVHDQHVAYLTIHGNKVIGSHLLPGLEADVQEKEHGIDLTLLVKKGTRFEKPVQMCFGMLPQTGLQEINMNVTIEEQAKINVIAHCTFPNAVDITHKMEAEIHVGKGAEYSYFERHVHGSTGGIKVIPKAKVFLAEEARFKTEFELLKGRVGLIDIDYETHCEKMSVLEMNARINGTEDDVIKIRETGFLKGEEAKGVLTSRIAVRDNAKAEVYNKLTASAAYARGHVDCKEIVQGNGIATAVPIVEVNHPKAHVTHEAAIGSVDKKQLDTLMSRGLDEDAASELIIQGLLR